MSIVTATATSVSDNRTSLLLTPKELAERIGVPISNIRYLIKSGFLEVIYTTPGKRNPKIPEKSWERYIESQRKHK